MAESADNDEKFRKITPDNLQVHLCELLQILSSHMAPGKPKMFGISLLKSLRECEKVLGSFSEATPLAFMSLIAAWIDKEGDGATNGVLREVLGISSLKSHVRLMEDFGANDECVNQGKVLFKLAKHISPEHITTLGVHLLKDYNDIERTKDAIKQELCSYKPENVYNEMAAVLIRWIESADDAATAKDLLDAAKNLEIATLTKELSAFLDKIGTQ